MELFMVFSRAFDGVVNVLSYPIEPLFNWSILRIGVTIAVLVMVKRFLLLPMLGRHKQDSATERNKKQ